MMSYGPSGSGRTFNLFGPDDPATTEAWFQFDKPHDLWGVFPRLGFDLYAMAKPSWTFQMKYFQNIADTVRDLLSPIGEEKKFDVGMHMDDEDHCMDIQWCMATQPKTWDDLRKTIKTACARKNTFPTQFNHRSTHGHSILTLEIIKPDPEHKGHLYVCDLAGTQPAEDIFYAKYEKIANPDGSIEHNVLGPADEERLTEDLQFQHRKSKLSLLEMAQLFLKTFQTLKQKKMKKFFHFHKSRCIHGFKSHFLCKFLKDTLFSPTRLYLFCSIRPERSYLQQTEQTLQFGKHASVVKIKQRQRSVKRSHSQEKLRRLVRRNSESALDTLDTTAHQRRQQQRQQQQLLLQQRIQAYAARGLALTALHARPTVPHFINIDADSFRSRRFIIFVDAAGAKTFGKDADIKPLSLTAPKHCLVTGTDHNKFTLQGIAGWTYLNGNLLENGAAPTPLGHFDRVLMGAEKFLFIIPPGESDPAKPAAEKALAKQLRELEETSKGWRWGNEPSANSKNANQQMDRLQSEVHKVKKYCHEMNRDMLSFRFHIPSADSSSEKRTGKVVVTQTGSKQTRIMHRVDFTTAASILKEEHTRIKLALEAGYEYQSPAAHDPIRLFMAGTQVYGAAVIFTEYLQYQLETDVDERIAEIKNVEMEKVGTLEMVWTPLASPDDLASTPTEEQFNDTPEAIVGKAWTYKLEIRSAMDMNGAWPRACVEYNFFGETFATDSVASSGSGFLFDYTRVHHVEVVTREFLHFLDQSMIFSVVCSRHINKIESPLPSTDDPVARARILGQAMLVPGLDTMDKFALQKRLCQETTKVRALTEQKAVMKTTVGTQTTAAAARQLPSRLPPRRATADAEYRNAMALVGESIANSKTVSCLYKVCFFNLT